MFLHGKQGIDKKYKKGDPYLNEIYRVWKNIQAWVQVLKIYIQGYEMGIFSNLYTFGYPFDWGILILKKKRLG